MPDCPVFTRAKNKYFISRHSRKNNVEKAKIQRAIFQGDALSPLLFIIAMMPFNHIVRKCIDGWKLRGSQEKINHLIYIDDVKLFAKNEKELETWIHADRIYSQDIGMKFGTEKCTMVIMKNSKRHLTNGMELLNQDKIRTLGEKEKYKYLGILEADTIKQMETKYKIKKEYLRKTRYLLETKLSSKILVKRINNLSVLLLDIRDPFWSRPEKSLSKWTKVQEN